MTDFIVFDVNLYFSAKKTRKKKPPLICSLATKYISNFENILNFLELFPQKIKLNSVDLRGLLNLEYLKLSNVSIDENSFLNLTKLRKLWIEICFQIKFYPNLLKNLVNLEILFLPYSQDLFSSSLSNLKNLKWIQLQKNNLESFESSLFQSLPSDGQLLVLDLFCNSIGDKAMGDSFKSLKQITTLKYLNLSSNFLESLEASWFSGTKCLIELDLETNNIKQLNLNNYLSSLEILVLKNNKINYLPEASFASLLDLKSLDLSSNRLTTMSKSFAGLHKLESLSLNRLETFTHIEDSSIFFGLSDSLTRLELQHNQLSFIDPAVFIVLPNLLELNLLGNALHDLNEQTFAGLKNLRSLNLSNNRLVYLMKNLFAPLSQLETLDLSINKLTELKDDAFLGAENLKSINLKGNELTSFNLNCIDSINFMKMQSIDLKENPLEKEQALVLASIISRVQIMVDYQ